MTHHANRAARWALIITIGLGWMAGPTAAAGAPQSQEQTRESWQRVDDIFRALGAKPGAVIADVGAGPGFFTERLARAVGAAGRVLAVDIDANTLRRLQDRIRADGLTNVETILGQPDDPKLPAGTLDGALIVNAYHEMVDYNAMLTRIRAALKPSGHLVIVEPIADARRDGARSAQTRQHEIAPQFVQQEARAAGFRVVGLEDPFVQRPSHDTEFMLVLAPAAAPPAEAPPSAEPSPDEVNAPSIRISAAEFAPLQRSARVVVLDVRDSAAYAKGHIPGARLAPMSELRNLVGELKASTLPIVAYCDCPAEETSARAVLYLRTQGITNVRALAGGWSKWVSSGGAVSVGNDPAAPQSALPMTMPTHAHEALSPERYESPRLAWQQPDAIVAALGVAPGQTVVDIGAGSGIMTRRFAVAVAPSGTATGLDIDPAMVEFMRQDARTRGLTTYAARLVTPDDPGLAASSVDLIFLMNTFHMMQNRVAYFARVRGALRPGGRVVIIDMPPGGFGPGSAPNNPSAEQVRAELEQAGYRLSRSWDFLLPRQFFFAFARGTLRD